MARRATPGVDCWPTQDGPRVGAVRPLHTAMQMSVTLLQQCLMLLIADHVGLGSMMEHVGVVDEV